MSSQINRNDPKTNIFTGYVWSKLVRNARDTGATSILARHVLDKTIYLLAEGFGQVDKMVAGTAQVRRTSEHLASASQEIKMVSQQSKIVSINAGIEANRAGGSGKAFNVVAQQMTSLSADVQGLTESIELKLTSLNETIGSSRELTLAVGTLFRDIRSELDEFRRLMMRVEELSLIQVQQLQEIEQANK